MTVWIIAACTIVCILIRPWRLPEATWACLSALVLLLLGYISPLNAFQAAARGTDVCLFLSGMMLLAALARREGVFEWLAGLALRSAGQSKAKLFTLIYVVGTAVTIFLSNDATAVVLTPAVCAAVRRAKTEPLPHLFVCAFIANAASFVLPISNPANLVLYGHNLPALLPWLRTFALPSILAIAATYVVLYGTQRSALRGQFSGTYVAVPLSLEGRRAAWGILIACVVLLAASMEGQPLGLPTLLCASLALALNYKVASDVVRDVSWNVLPLVLGLFTLVEALNGTGASKDLANLLGKLGTFPVAYGLLSASTGIGLLSNLMNNLPAGLLAADAVSLAHVPTQLRDAVLIGVDLGPNLSVTGSLATILWLIALRREGIEVSAWSFLRLGTLVMLPALALATLGLLL